MKQYKEHLQAILTNGTHKPAARPGMPGTTSLFGYQWRHNLADGFPLLTTKKVFFKNIVVELLWFLKGDTNIKYLIDNGCNIWNEDAYNYYKKLGGNQYSFEQFVEVIKFNSLNGLLERGRDQMFKDRNYVLGDCGKQYGWLWRNWVGLDTIDNGTYTLDQIKELINGLKNNPMSRRHIITAWNPATLDDMALNACHAFVQFNCRPIIQGTHINGKYYEIDKNKPKYFLDCQMYQRSADSFLGIPYNIASYALLNHIIAKICGMVPGEMIYSYGDSHIYDNHLDQVKEQLTREEKPLPTLSFKDEFHYICDSEFSQANPLTIIDEMKINWFQLENYDSHPPIKGELSTGLIK